MNGNKMYNIFLTIIGFLQAVVIVLLSLVLTMPFSQEKRLTNVERSVSVYDVRIGQLEQRINDINENIKDIQRDIKLILQKVDRR